MYRSILCFYCLISVVFADSRNLLILDYFSRRNVSSIVGFSCNVVRDDILLIKSFNRFGVKVALINSRTNRSIETYAKAIYWRIGVFVDLRCNNEQISKSILSQASNYRMYDELHYWLIVGNDLKRTLSIIDDDSFGVSTDFVIAAPSRSRTNGSYELYDVYNIWKKRGSILNLTVIGSWNKTDRISFYFENNKVLRRGNLYGITVRASFFSSKYKPQHIPLLDYLQDYSNHPKDGLSKFGFTIVTHLSEMFNFTIKVGTVKWKVGDSVGPIIRALMGDEIDLSGSPATMSAKRTYFVHFMVQMWPFRSCFMFRNPQPQTIKVNEVLGPLDIQVWYLMILLYGFALCFLATLYKYETLHSTITQYSDAFLTISGSLCQQSANTPMKNVSTRIAFLHIIIFSSLVYNYYSASIVSARLNEPIYKMNDSLSQLAKSGLKVASEWMAYFELFIRQQDWETKTFYTSVWQKLPESEQFIEPERGMELVKKGGFAYHMHPDVGYSLINRHFDNREICELMEVHLASLSHSTFAVSRNCTFTEMIRVGLTKISEVGIKRRQIRRWTALKPQCVKSNLSSASVDIYEFAPHLVILIFGLIVALVILLLEIISARRNTKKIVERNKSS